MPVIDRDRWRQLEPLLDEVLDLTAEEQAAWLGSLRSRAPDLAEELGALLSSSDAADRSGFLASPLPMMASGLELGPWTLEHVLGQGGMGTVWLARRADGRFDGRAAVKFLNIGLLGHSGQERFRREGSMLARLAHPGIARLLDAGVSESGQPYLVIEHVDGERIDTWAASRALSPEECIALVLRVFAAVEHAHAHLIVHRDIKPTNILVTGDGAPKLLDFGIAKLLDDERTGEHSALTLDGGRVMTPEFAAPEQVRGEPVTTATDVYALGLLLYLLLSGRHPTAEGCRTALESMDALLEREPAPLGLGDLDTILAKALRKEPRERYQTVAAFGEDLTRFLGHEPVSARPYSLAYRARKFIRRNRAAVTGASIAVAALIGATGFSIAQRREAERQRDLALAEAKLSDAMDALQNVLAGDSRGTDGRQLTLPERIALAEHVVARQFRSDPRLVAQLTASLAAKLSESGDLHAGRRVLARARAIARASDLPAQIALADCYRAESFALEDRLDSARIDLAEAKAALARAGEDVGWQIPALCLSAEGQLLVAAGAPDSGIAVLRRFVELTEQDPIGVNRVRALSVLAEALRLGGHTRESVPYHLRVLATLDSSGYGETDMAPSGALYVATALWEVGEPGAIDSALRPLVREQEAAHGTGRTSTLLAFLYGQAKLRVGEYDSADVWIARAMRDTTQGAGGIGTGLPAALTELRLAQGRIGDARRASETLPTRSRGQRATAAWLRAMLRRAAGDAPGAGAMLERELRDVMSDTTRPPIAFLAIPLVTAGEWRLAAGDARGADSLARVAIRTASANDSLALSRSAFVGRADLLRARARLAMRDTAGARDDARRAAVALAVGYGPANAWTGAAIALRDSLGG